MKHRRRRQILLGCAALFALPAVFIGFSVFASWDRHRGWVRPCTKQDAPLSPGEVQRIFDDHAEERASAESGEKQIPLYKLAMFGMDTEADYWDLVKAYTKPIHIRPGEKVFESGCGTGAFLQAIQMLYGTKESPLHLSGIDFSQKAVDVAKAALRVVDPSVSTRLLHGEVQKLPVPSDTYDVVISFSVFGYLPTEEDVVKAVEEMLRVAKPGGRVFIGNVNDADKQGVADCMGTQRMFIKKSVWEEFAARRARSVVGLKIIDGYDIWHKLFGYDMAARFRYSVYFEKHK